jgi:hypothetical protein
MFEGQTFRGGRPGEPQPFTRLVDFASGSYSDDTYYDARRTAPYVERVRQRLAAIKRVVRHSNRSWFSAAEEREISRTLRGEGEESPPSNPWQWLFGRLLERRLSWVPAEIATEVRQVLARTTPQRASKLRADYDVASSSIRLELPEQLAETPLHYALLLHELEHVIQEKTLGAAAAGLRRPEDDEATLGRLHLSHRYSHMQLENSFLHEKGAAGAHWNYFRLVPVNARRRVVDAFLEMPGIEEKKRRETVARMEAADLPLSTYLKLMHSLDDYSPKSFSIGPHTVTPRIPEELGARISRPF